MLPNNQSLSTLKGKKEVAVTSRPAARVRGRLIVP